MTTLSIPATAPKPPRGGPVKKSRRGRTRAIVLIAVHIAFIVHLAHWAATGSTITPVEPSESMQTLENGIINAGFVFFVITLLATLVLGRFFCGWACHVVAYQDLAAWLCGKVGLRPKPVRSRLLMWTPMFLALYMFVWPQLVRAFQTREFRGWQAQFTTPRFWETFAGPWMAVLTLIVCGFIVVYWLGAKGFCTYGCPYGAFFGVTDRFAPGRIRVTDACKGCRHCTATCTSNVLVHREVAEFGMVVDPGCMKCMDCVNVCPEDALYFGFGKPSIAAKSKARGKPATRRWAVDAIVFALLFGIAFWWMDHPQWWRGDDERVPSWALAILAGGVALALTLSGRRKGAFDFSRGEEIAMAIVFLLASQWAFRALYASVPHLLAIGLGSLTALAVIVTWRLVRARDFSLQHHALRADGKLTGVGRVVAVGLIVWFAFTGHSAFVQYHMRAAERVIAEASALEFEQREPLFTAANGHLTTAATAGLFDSSYLQFLFGAIANARGEHADAVRRFARSSELHPQHVDTRLRLSDAQMRVGEPDAALATLESLADEYPEVAEAHARLGTLAFQRQQFEEAIRRTRAAIAIEPGRAGAWIMLAESLMASGNANDAATVLYDMLDVHPNHPEAVMRLQKLGLNPAKRPGK